MKRSSLLFLAILLSCNSAFAQTTTGRSPSGHILVELVQTEHYVATGKMEDLDDINHVRYDVFFEDERGDTLAGATYADVYGWDSLATPTEPNLIIARIEWSPEEDFALLPAEGWASYGGPFPRAVNLQKDKQWETIEIRDLEGWVSPTQPYMSWMLDCDYGVAIFDAITGNFIDVRVNEGDLGYVLLENDGLGHVVIKSEPTNCTTQEYREQFVSQCERWDLSAMRYEPVACPEND